MDGIMSTLRILVLAFALNWAWEATHAVAYVESSGPFLFRVRHCLPMAAADAVWTLAMWIVVGMFRALHRQHRLRLALLAGLGATTAVVVERLALADGRWTYNDLMPIVPIVNVGLWPVAQMTILPVITIWLSSRAGRAGDAFRRTDRSTGSNT